MIAEKPHNEDERLNALERIGIVGSDPEPAFDAIAKRAAEACATPLALITFITHDRQWIKAAHGLDLKETTRDASFCAWAIHSEDVFCVEDAMQDHRFQDNPLVVQAPYIRYYAGAPIATPEGYLLGAVCVLDRKARSIDAAHRATLQACAAEVSVALARRLGGATASGAGAPQ